MTRRREVRIAWGASSHRGARRTQNQDRFLASSSAFFVADGMGGHEAGEIASQVAIEALRPLAALPLVRPRDVMGCLTTAHHQVRAIVTGPGRGAGTTISGVVVAERNGMPNWLVVNVGDSRTYRLSQGRLDQISVDHTEVQELVDAGVLTHRQAKTYSRRHVVTRALGSHGDLKPDFWYLPIRAHDRMLICSDGLTGELTNDRISEVLLSRPDPQSAADSLVHEAICAGGRDNITVVVIDATGVPQDTGGEYTGPRDLVALTDEDTLPQDVRLQIGGLS